MSRHQALVIFEKQLGDGVQLEPALRHLVTQHSGGVALHGTPVLQILAELMPGVRWEASPFGKEFAEVWVFEPGTRAARKAFLGRAPRKRLRLRKWSHREWFHRWVFHEIELREHKNLTNALFFLKGVNSAANEAIPQLQLPPEEWRHPALPDEPYIGINMTASLRSKLWEPGKWKETLEHLSSKSGKRLVLLGAGEEAMQQHVREASRNVPVVDLLNKTNLREFIHAVSRAEAQVAIEGASSHLAAAFGVPTAAIFSAGNSANPLNWFAPSKKTQIFIAPEAKWSEHGQPLEGGNELAEAVVAMVKA